MPRTRQTARKTTGGHSKFTSALSGIQVQSPAEFKPPRPNVRYAVPQLPEVARPGPKKAKKARLVHHTHARLSPGPGSSRSKPSATKSVLKARPTVAVPFTALYSKPVSIHPDREPLLPSNLDVPLPAGGAFTNGIPPASGALIRRRPAVGVLDMPISVCTRFATWLESQTCVHDETLLRAVERDGRRLLCLAKATVIFENALRGNVPPVNGAVSPLMEHARMLRVFAEVLDVKIAEGSLSEELETAVLRDGEALLRLAICCLDFDQAVQGSGSAQVK